MTVPLKGKVVVITGASSGFGKDAAHLFAAEGARVVLTARRIERMQAEVELIQAAGGEAIFIPMDVSVLEDIDRMVKTVMDQYGRIDILFNNAGFGRLDWFSQLDLQTDIHTQVDVNLVGLMNVTTPCCPACWPSTAARSSTCRRSRAGSPRPCILYTRLQNMACAVLQMRCAVKCARAV